MPAGSISRALIHTTDWLPTLCDKALGDCDLSGAQSGLKGLPLDGVSAWAAISRGEPSKRNEIMHDLWFQGDPDPESRAGLKPHWAALHLVNNLQAASLAGLRCSHRWRCVPGWHEATDRIWRRRLAAIQHHP